MSYRVELQSLRGIAALVVVMHHSFFYYNSGFLKTYIGEYILNAHAAVVFFYVLSGFVLSIALSDFNFSIRSYTVFIFRRFFRIYPALWFSILLALVYIWVFNGVPVIGQNVNNIWTLYREDIKHSKVIAAFFGVGSALPIPIWSIFVELVAAPLMPILLWAIARKSNNLFYFFGVCLFFLSFIYGKQTRMNVGVYLIDFWIGVFIFKEGGKMVDCLIKYANPKYILVLGLITILFGRMLGPWSYAIDYHSPFASLIEALSSAVVIALVVYTDVDLLKRPILIKLGDISYSLYLIHLPILAILYGLFGDILKFSFFNMHSGFASVLVMWFTLMISLPLSKWLYENIEMPVNQFGKKIFLSVKAR